MGELIGNTTIVKLVVTSLRLALVIGLAMACARMSGWGYFSRLDSRVLDFRLIQRGEEPASDRIAIVAVDDASLERVGRWPWSRAVVADLLNRIQEARPLVVGFDIVQSEESDDESAKRLTDRLESAGHCEPGTVRAALDAVARDDRVLADALGAHDNVVLGYFFDFESPRAESGTEEPLRATQYNFVRNSDDGSGEGEVPKAAKAVVNLKPLAAAVRGSGYFNVFPDEGDGLYRRAPLVVRYGDTFAAPLALAMLRVARPDEPLAIDFNEYGVSEIRVGELAVPVAEDGMLLINYRGMRHAFDYVSAADLLEGRIEPERLRDKLVLVGVTATGVADVRATPFDGVFPGVEIQATVLDNVLRADFIEQPRWVDIVEAGSCVAVALLLGLALQYLRGVSGALVAVVLVPGYVLATQRLFVESGFAIGLVYPLGTIGVVYTVVSVFHYVTESREKRRIRDAFALYLNPTLARLVSERPGLLRLGGEEREVTVMFADIRGFTRIATDLTPQSLVELLNAFMTEMTDIIFRHDGTLDKYIGDAIMALWGAPLRQDDHARLACLAAVEMQDRMVDLRAELETRGWPSIEVGIGIHTGPMVLGNMGSERRLCYTVIGHNANIGARLETLTKLYGSPILVSEEALRLAGDGFTTREIDLVRVAEKAEPLRVFEIMGNGDSRASSRESIAGFEEGLAAYRARRWEAAIAAFERVLADSPQDRAAAFYRERNREYLTSEPGETWEAVTLIEK